MIGGWHDFTTLPPPDQTKVRQRWRTQRNWTGREVKVVKAMRDALATEIEIAFRLGRTPSSVRGITYRMKLPHKPGCHRRWNRTEEATLATLWGQGVQIRAICHDLDRSIESITSKAHAMGLAPRHSS